MKGNIYKKGISGKLTRKRWLKPLSIQWKWKAEMHFNMPVLAPHRCPLNSG